jgi:hypothetical protein
MLLTLYPQITDFYSLKEPYEQLGSKINKFI